MELALLFYRNSLCFVGFGVIIGCLHCADGWYIDKRFDVLGIFLVRN